MMIGGVMVGFEFDSHPIRATQATFGTRYLSRMDCLLVDLGVGDSFSFPLCRRLLVYGRLFSFLTFCFFFLLLFETIFVSRFSFMQKVTKMMLFCVIEYTSSHVLGKYCVQKNIL